MGGSTSGRAKHGEAEFLRSSLEAQSQRDASDLEAAQRLSVPGPCEPLHTEILTVRGSRKPFALAADCALKGHTGMVASAVFNGNGRHVLTASDDKTARL
jgi:hypothetical protein